MITMPGTTTLEAADHGSTPGQARHLRLDAERMTDLITAADIFVEFGCTDGRRLKDLKNSHPERTFIGFDAKPLLELGQGDPRGVAFFDDWDFLASVVAAERAAGRRVCLIVSSPVQGIFTRMTDRDAEQFQRQVWNAGFDIVAHRDAGTEA